ncbi:ATP-dependent DNA helicase [Trichonephila inaurata madagascariensis]|uniref:ATP-dependent DNA helicase n=1 Tax=Trichonephila inaurata madagascariensis TaxID=2747483 RepID=A0A8X6WQA8_9ARAC|nr:ATP-dependent DNA helicase [Trichonephila inaurata madagascariensis]
MQRAETPPETTLTSFFVICQSDPFARTLLYSEMPRYYTWNASSKNFQRWKQGDAVPGYLDVRSTDALGRIYTVIQRTMNVSICGCCWYMCVGQRHLRHYGLLMV